MTRAALLLALVLGCAHRGAASRAPAEAEPGWATAEGRTAARLDLARTLLDMGRPQEALTLLAEARAESRDELQVDLLQARADLALGMTGEAAALLEPWVTRGARDPDLYRLLGLVRFDQERLDEAEQAFREALARDDDSFVGNNNLGFLLLVRGRPDEALPLLRRALELAPDEARARSNLGFALAALGRDEEALEVFRAVHPEALALVNLGLACERRGATADALAWYQRALGVEPDQTTAAEAVRRLSPPGDIEVPP